MLNIRNHGSGTVDAVREEEEPPPGRPVVMTPLHPCNHEERRRLNTGSRVEGARIQ